MRLRATFDDLLDTLLPARCAGCGRPGASVCTGCARLLTPAPAAPAPQPLDWWAACFAYEGVARELVARAKYRDERRFLAVIAGELAGALAPVPAPIDVITWAPASARRIRTHGVDHAELLARALGRVTGSPVAATLARRPGPPQTGLDAATRRAGPHLVPVGRCPGAVVLVVDDVATTGGTLAAAARVLLDRGAAAVFGATIARTPRPGTARAPAAYTSGPPAGLRARAAPVGTNSIGSQWTSSSSAST